MTSPSCRLSGAVELQPVLHRGAHDVGDEHRHSGRALADQVAVRVDDADRIVLVFVDVGAERRPRDVDVDLVGDGDKAAPDHLDGDRIDRCGSAARPMPRLASMAAVNVDLSELADGEACRAGRSACSIRTRRSSAGPCPLKPGFERIAVIDLGRQETVFVEEEDRPRPPAPASAGRSPAWPDARYPAASCAGSRANAARPSRPRRPALAWP